MEQVSPGFLEQLRYSIPHDEMIQVLLSLLQIWKRKWMRFKTPGEEKMRVEKMRAHISKIARDWQITRFRRSVWRRHIKTKLGGGFNCVLFSPLLLKIITVHEGSR